MSFSKLGLSPALINAIKEQEYKKPYPIQEKAIPAILARKDVLGIARTGSGKTASFVLPILQAQQANFLSKNRHVSTLILVPTRELAMQVEEVVYSFSKNLPMNVKSLAVYGGVSINPQMIALQNVSILVATPGRLLELVEKNAVHLSSINTLVVDEADKMLNLGFKEEMSHIFALLPSKRQNLLFSATLSENIESIHEILLDNPLVINAEEKTEDTLSQIEQLAYHTSEENKGPLLRYLIKTKNLTSVLIFTSSTYKADNVANKLRKNGVRAAAIHSKKSQGARKKALQKFKDGEIIALVATDLLARGIDIDSLPYVINYELPRSPKDYVHRIGRTGRANAKGQSITFVTETDKHHFRVIQKKMGKWVTINNLESFDLTAY